MASTKDTEKVVEEHVAETVAPPVEPTTTKAVKPKGKQTVITFAIISGVVLFFVGLGLGYAWGHGTTSSRSNVPGSGKFTPPESGGGRRTSPNSGTDNTTNGDGESDDSSDSTSNTQTN